MSEDKSVEELRKETQKGARTESVATVPDYDGSDTEPLADRLDAALDKIDAGDQPPTVAVRDTPVAALLRAVDDTEDIDAIGSALAEELDREHDGDFDRSEVLRYAVRVGLQDAAGEYMDAVGDVVAQRARENI